MKTISFTIRGIRPLMISAEQPFEDANGSNKPVKAKPSAMEQAETHLHKTKLNGRETCVIPGINLQKSIQAAYPYMPSPGKRKGWISLIRTISIDELHMPIETRSTSERSKSEGW